MIPVAATSTENVLSLRTLSDHLASHPFLNIFIHFISSFLASLALHTSLTCYEHPDWFAGILISRRSLFLIQLRMR